MVETKPIKELMKTPYKEMLQKGVTEKEMREAFETERKIEKEDVGAAFEEIEALNTSVLRLIQLRDKLTQCLRYEDYSDFRKCSLKAIGWEE